MSKQSLIDLSLTAEQRERIQQSLKAGEAAELGIMELEERICPGMRIP
jgi:hypothetical protein